MAFKRLTRPQREAMKALRELGGEMMVTPQDARSLAVLKRRGLVRYRRDEHGVRLVVLRETTAQARARKREERLYGNLSRWLRYEVATGRR
jgi:DNA-binding MarR family transcriptional regulator